MLQYIWNVPGAYFENCFRKIPRVKSETRIKKAGVMDAKFSGRCIKRQQHSGDMRRDGDSLLGCQNIEITRIQDEPLMWCRWYCFPEVIRIIIIHFSHVNNWAMLSCSIAYNSWLANGVGQINGNPLAIDQGIALSIMVFQWCTRGIDLHFLLFISRKTNLVQGKATLNYNTETSWCYFQKQRTGITFGGDIKLYAMVGYEPCKDIDPPGAALGICKGLDVFWKRQGFIQHDHIHASLFEYSGP